MVQTAGCHGDDTIVPTARCQNPSRGRGEPGEGTNLTKGYSCQPKPHQQNTKQVSFQKGALSPGSCAVTHRCQCCHKDGRVLGATSPAVITCILPPLPWTRGPKTTGEPISQKGLSGLSPAAQSPSRSASLLSSWGCPSPGAPPFWGGRPPNAYSAGADSACGTGTRYRSLQLFYKGSGTEVSLF